MQCVYHPENEAASTCRDCLKPLCADCAVTGQCTVCAARDAARDLQQTDRERVAELEVRAAKKKRLARVGPAALWGLLGLCVIVAGWQLPAVLSSIKAEKPLRNGTYHTDAGADACIANLWTVSRMLQEGQTSTAAIFCPASGQAYVPRTGADGVAYHCPQPGRHGLRALQVSRFKPVPEVLK